MAITLGLQSHACETTQSSARSSGMARTTSSATGSCWIKLTHGAVSQNAQDAFMVFASVRRNFPSHLFAHASLVGLAPHALQQHVTLLVEHMAPASKTSVIASPAGKRALLENAASQSVQAVVRMVAHALAPMSVTARKDGRLRALTLDAMLLFVILLAQAPIQNVPSPAFVSALIK